MKLSLLLISVLMAISTYAQDTKQDVVKPKVRQPKLFVEPNHP